LPYVKDYLGFDEDTGKIIHFHVHYKLILGEKKVKNYHLPIESFTLSHKKIYHNVYIPQNEMELLLLLIRVGLKTDLISIIVSVLRKRNTFPVNIVNEFNFLLKGYREDRFRDILKRSRIKLNNKWFYLFVKKLRAKKINYTFLLRYRLYIKKTFKKYRRYNTIICWARIIRSLFRNNIVIKRIVRNNKKRLIHSGRIFALVGADGSGKTTLVKILKKWLEWKLNTKRYYFGIPKNQYIKILNYFVAMSHFLAFKLLKMKRNYSCLNSIKWITVARVRFKQFKRAKHFIKRGGIVITDRYPPLCVKIVVT